MEYVNHRVIDGVVVTAYRDCEDPRKTYLVWGDQSVPVDLRACWTEEGIREVMRRGA